MRYKEDEIILDCRELSFSPRLCAERVARTQVLLGKTVLVRLLAWALFLLGVRRPEIVAALEMPEGTLRTLMRRLHAEGLRGLLDRRRKDAGLPPPPPLPADQREAVYLDEDGETVCLGGARMRLPSGNKDQKRVVLLSLMGEEMLGTTAVAEALGITPAHARKLKRALVAGDVEAVLDKRAGQVKDYRVDELAKAQLIEQFVVDLAARGRTSAPAVARRVASVYDRSLPERTVRHHLHKLGLPLIKESLLAQLEEVKKTPQI